MGLTKNGNYSDVNNAKHNINDNGIITRVNKINIYYVLAVNITNTSLSMVLADPIPFLCS